MAGNKEINGIVTAETTPYDNTSSGLVATNVQSAIDEVKTLLSEIPKAANVYHIEYGLEAAPSDPDGTQNKPFATLQEAIAILDANIGEDVMFILHPIPGEIGADVFLDNYNVVKRISFVAEGNYEDKSFSIDVIGGALENVFAKDVKIISGSISNATISLFSAYLELTGGEDNTIKSVNSDVVMSGGMVNTNFVMDGGKITTDGSVLGVSGTFSDVTFVSETLVFHGASSFTKCYSATPLVYEDTSGGSLFIDGSVFQFINQIGTSTQVTVRNTFYDADQTTFEGVMQDTRPLGLSDDMVNVWGQRAGWDAPAQPTLRATLDSISKSLSPEVSAHQTGITNLTINLAGHSVLQAYFDGNMNPIGAITFANGVRGRTYTVLIGSDNNGTLTVTNGGITETSDKRISNSLTTWLTVFCIDPNYYYVHSELVF